MRRELQWEIDLEWRIREQLRENKILVFFFFYFTIEIQCNSTFIIAL